MILRGEVTFDLIMDDDMPFVEGCYRSEDGDWHVFIAIKSKDGAGFSIKKDLSWESGVRGVNIVFPENSKIDKSVVLKALSEAAGILEWTEVRGPDSMKLR